MSNNSDKKPKQLVPDNWADPLNQSSRKTNSLKPTIEKEIGRYTDQIFHFKGNVKRTFEGIDSEYTKEGSTLKLKTKDGRMLLINVDNLLMTEVFQSGE